MYSIEEISIHNMIIHILDSNLSLPVLSKEEYEATYEIKEFFSNHIVKVLNNDALRTCVFYEENNMLYDSVTSFADNKEPFIDMSMVIANQLFEIMHSNIDIPSADLAVIQFACRGTSYLALLKLNYIHSYVHYTEKNANSNGITLHKTTLPNTGQNIQEAAIINLSTWAIQLLEKKYEIDGNKEFYLSKYLLKCSTALSSKEQYNIVKRVVDSMNNKYYTNDVEKQLTMKQTFYNNIEEDGQLDIEKIANDTFKNNLELKEEFLESLSKKGLEDSTIQLSEKTIQRSFGQHKLKTDQGIEIKIPMEVYDDFRNIKFIIEPDGKQSIIIKNINKITHG